MHAWVAQEFERRMVAELTRWLEARPAATRAMECHLQAGLRHMLVCLAEELNGNPAKILERYSFEIKGLGPRYCPTCYYQMPHDGNVTITVVDSKRDLSPEDKLWADRECWGPEVQHRGGWW